MSTTPPYTWRRVGREWLIALSSYALLIAPFGCQIQSDIVNGDGNSNPSGSNLSPTSTGLFINDDLTSPVVAGGRNAAGDAFYVYGTRASNGSLGEVSEILVKTAAGQQSFIRFDKGRPVYLQGPDGSNLQIAYTQITPVHLLAQATLYDPNGTQLAAQSADIDLTQTAQQVAQAVQSLTGQTISVPTGDNVRADPNATAKLRSAAGADGADVGKVVDRGQHLLMALGVGVALVALSELAVVLSGQVMNSLFVAVSAVVRATLLVVFSPVILLADLLSEVSQHVFATPLIRVFIQLPSAP